MYNELVKRLRTYNGWALNKTLDAAADALEELQQNIEQYKLYLQDAINDLHSAHEAAERRERMITNEELESRFTYHAPKNDMTGRYISIREKAKELAYMIDMLCPESRERSLAMTKIEECVMWAIEAIARNEDGRTKTL